jgi:hypothetical protein
MAMTFHWTMRRTMQYHLTTHSCMAVWFCSDLLIALRHCDSYIIFFLLFYYLLLFYYFFLFFR